MAGNIQLDDVDEEDIPDSFRDNLSREQQQCLLLEIKGDKQETIADHLEIARSTIWRWNKKDEDYQEAKKTLLNDYLTDDLLRVMSHTDEVAETLVQAIKNQDPDVALKVFDRIYGNDGLQQQALNQGGEIVAQDPQEENLLRVFRRNKANKRMLEYISLLIEEKEPEEVIDIVHQELTDIEETKSDSDVVDGEFEEE